MVFELTLIPWLPCYFEYSLAMILELFKLALVYFGNFTFKNLHLTFHDMIRLEKSLELEIFSPQVSFAVSFVIPPHTIILNSI